MGIDYFASTMAGFQLTLHELYRQMNGRPSRDDEDNDYVVTVPNVGPVGLPWEFDEAIADVLKNDMFEVVVEISYPGESFTVSGDGSYDADASVIIGIDVERIGDEWGCGRFDIGRGIPLQGLMKIAPYFDELSRLIETRLGVQMKDHQPGVFIHYYVG